MLARQFADLLILLPVGDRYLVHALFEFPKALDLRIPHKVDTPTKAIKSGFHLAFQASDGPLDLWV
jgi:hypothetical protein